MRFAFKTISLILSISCAVLLLVAYSGLKKSLKKMKEQNEDELLSEEERKACLRYSIFIAAGVVILVISAILRLILIFL